MIHLLQQGGRAAFDPVVMWGELTQQALAAGPYPLAAATHRRRFEHYYRWFQTWLAPFGTARFEFDDVEVAGAHAAVTERVACVTPFCTLRAFHCSRGSRRKPRPRVLLCAPLAGHRAVLMRDTVAALLPHADVYVTDWADARDVPREAGAFGLDDYVLLVERFIRLLDPAGLHVLAVCQATVPALAAVSRVAQADGAEPATLTLIGGPIDARLGPTTLDRVAATLSLPWLEATAIDVVPSGYAGAGRRIYPGFLQYPALVAAQPDRHATLMYDWLCRRQAADADTAREIERAVAQYGAVLDMTAEFFFDTLRVVFQQMLLPKGAWRVGGEMVRPDCLRRTRLLTIEGDRDDISGPGQTHAAQGLCSGLPTRCRERLTIERCDHYGLFSGARWRETVHPAVRSWLGAAA